MARKKAPLGNWDEVVGPDGSRSMGYSVKAYLKDDSKNLSSKYAWDQETADAQASQEKTSKDGNPDITELVMQVPNDVLGSSSSSISDTGFAVLTAPTQKPSRPRALSIAYNPNTKVIYVVFRDNTWWQYNDVGTEVWLGLSNSSSTTEYLPTLENECSSHGPAKLINMSAAAMAQLSGLAETAARIQKA